MVTASLPKVLTTQTEREARKSRSHRLYVQGLPLRVGRMGSQDSWGNQGSLLRGDTESWWIRATPKMGRRRSALRELDTGECQGEGGHSPLGVGWGDTGRWDADHEGPPKPVKKFGLESQATVVCKYFLPSIG